MHVLGLTGGISSGKSTVAAFLRERGAPVIDADVLGHRAYQPGTEAFRAVVAAFGEDVVAADGSIDRRQLGAKVFGNPKALGQLTGIVWPEIRKLAEQEIAALEAAGHALTVLEAAVLLEAGWQDLVDEIWVAVVDPEGAIVRLAKRNGLDEAAARARIDSQLSNAERIAQAHVTIENNGSLADLEAAVQGAWDRLRQTLDRPGRPR